MREGFRPSERAAIAEAIVTGITTRLIVENYYGFMLRKNL